MRGVRACVCVLAVGQALECFLPSSDEIRKTGTLLALSRRWECFLPSSDEIRKTGTLLALSSRWECFLPSNDEIRKRLSGTCTRCPVVEYCVSGSVFARARVCLWLILAYFWSSQCCCVEVIIILSSSTAQYP